MLKFLKHAFSVFNSSKKSEGESVVSIISKIGLAQLGTFIFPVILLFVVGVSIIAIFSYGLNVLRFVDDSGSAKTGLAIYDAATLEEYYAASEQAVQSSNKPSFDLASSEHKSVDGFNQFIKNTVCKAGFGTREGVVAAGVSLIGDYIKSTGKRIRYNQKAYYCDGSATSRQEPGVDGIVNDDFYLDCSSFSWWALYNGGFNLPDTSCQTDNIYNWSVSQGISKEPADGGVGGDFLVTRGKGHIMLIIGNYDGGYYVAEEYGCANGGVINKRSFDNLNSNNYALIDMSNYYADSSNIRTDSSC